jgi:hypothetical protein
MARTMPFCLGRNNVDNRLKLTEETLNYIIDNEARKLVGTCLKRIEIPIEIKVKEGKEVILNKEELENIKSQLKNLIYESLRTIRDIIRINGKDSISLTIKDKNEK